MNRAVPPSCASRGPAGEGRSDSQRETLVADRFEVWIIEPSPTRAQVAEAQLGARTDSYGHAARAVATADQLMTPRRPVIECADGRDRAIVNVVRKDEEDLGLRRVGIDLDPDCHLCLLRGTNQRRQARHQTEPFSRETTKDWQTKSEIAFVRRE